MTAITAIPSLLLSEIVRNPKNPPQEQSCQFWNHEMSIQSPELQTTELQSLERERVFDLFRRWGYMDAELYPFGGPIAGGFPEIRIGGPIAEEARRIYCGTIGAEVMHLPARERRAARLETMDTRTAA